MKRLRHRPTWVLALVLVAGLLAGSGCVTFSSGLADTAATPAVIGPAHGFATTVHFLGVIPLDENSGPEQAYQNAVASVPGAGALTRATMTTSLIHLGIIEVEITRIRGLATKRRAPAAPPAKAPAKAAPARK